MRGFAVVNLAIQGQERTAIEKKQCEAQEEQDALKCSLAAVTEDHHHPKERYQRSSGENEERKKEVEAQSGVLARILRWEGEHGNSQVQDFSCIA